MGSSSNRGILDSVLQVLRAHVLFVAPLCTDFLEWEAESERLRDEALPKYARARTKEEKDAIVKQLQEELILKSNKAI